MAFITWGFIWPRYFSIPTGAMRRNGLVTPQTIFLAVTCGTTGKPTTGFISVVKCPASLVNIYERYTALLVARETFCALMATVTHALISYSVNIV